MEGAHHPGAWVEKSCHECDKYSTLKQWNEEFKMAILQGIQELEHDVGLVPGKGPSPPLLTMTLLTDSKYKQKYTFIPLLTISL